MTHYQEIIEIQKSILNGDTHYKGKELPTRQLAGTSYQKSSHAFMQAKDFQETLK